MNKIVSFTLVLALVACQNEPASEKVEMPPALDVSYMDQSIDPKADFYRFANGNWLDKTEIPDDEGRWGGFGELSRKNNKKVLQIMESSAENPEFESGSDERKAIDFFAVGMDSSLAEKAGSKPIQAWLDKIDALESKSAVRQILAELHSSGYNSFNDGFNVIPHLKKSTLNAMYLGSGGLGLPNRDYYTKEDQKSQEIRDKYVAHVERMFGLVLGQGDYSGTARDIMNLENALALKTLTPIEQRNLPALYNPMTVGDIQKIAPQFDWASYLSEMGVEEVDTIIVTEPEFIKEMARVIDETELGVIKDYLKWNVINRASAYLNNEIVQANFDFYGKVIRGTKEMRPRWERVLSSTNSVMGEAIGKVYVAETFPPEAKASAEEMVKNLITAFENRIQNLEWMSDSTKQQALKKLGRLTVKIGYPDEWKDYSALQVQNSGEDYSYLRNMENAWKFQHQDNLDDLGQDVDKKEWQMSPQTVNAYFHPLNNEIVFPAAILQPPFYNYTADAAMNYGGMGAVIGHEISHGFDDNGSRFDPDGNMINWWSEEDKKKFEARTEDLVAQFDAYEPLDSVFVQGKLTLGENIGDLGGLNAAYDALQIYYQSNEKPGLIDGYTQEQRFFISWATIWRTKYRDEFLRTQVMTDPHSPGPYRAIGPLVNMETFFQAFDIKEGDPLWKPVEERVNIW